MHRLAVALLIAQSRAIVGAAGEPGRPADVSSFQGGFGH